MNIFRTFWKSIKELFEELFILALVNILWIIVNLPFVLAMLVLGGAGPVAIFVVMLAGTLTFGPANAGLYAIAERVTEGRTSSWRHFVEGMREYAALSWKVYGLWMLGFTIIVFNLLFYNNGNASIISWIISVVFLYLALVWFGMLIYIGPLMRIQTDKRIRTIARNAALMTFGRPVFTVVTLLMMGVILVVSGLLPFLMLIVTFSFLGLWGFRATLALIAEAEARKADSAARSAPQVTEKGRGGQIRPRE